MRCFYCGKDFELQGEQGGQNRLFCYDCLPPGLQRRQREIERRHLFWKKADEEKRSQGCSICGYNKYGSVLEWHHTESTNKEYNPGELIKDGTMTNWIKYQEEISKCILLCANCHRELHIEQDDNWRQNQIFSQKG